MPFQDESTGPGGGGGGGTIGGSGTANRVARFTPDGTTIGNASATDDGSTIALTANTNLGAAAGTTAVDFSSGTGLFKTTTGANTLSGTVTVASGKAFSSAGGAGNFDWSSSSGTFATPTGAATMNGSASFAVGKSLTIGAAESIGTAQTPLLTVQNTTTATSGNQKFSPMEEFIGQEFNTTSATSVAVKGAWQIRPVQGTNATEQTNLVCWISRGQDAGAYTEAGFFAFLPNGTSGWLQLTGASGALSNPTSMAVGQRTTSGTAGAANIYTSTTIGFNVGNNQRVSMSDTVFGPGAQGTTITLGSNGTGWAKMYAKRPFIQGTATVNTDYALSAGWGTTATVTVTTNSTDGKGTILVSSSGTGQAANPTVTFTFKDGTWSAAPFAIVVPSGGTGTQVHPTWTVSATVLTITYPATPVAGSTYQFDYHVIGAT